MLPRYSFSLLKLFVSRIKVELIGCTDSFKNFFLYGVPVGLGILMELVFRSRDDDDVAIKNHALPMIPGSDGGE